MLHLVRSFFKLSLSLQMASAAFAGIFMGLFLGEYCSIFSSWSRAYVMILKVTTIPFLICALIHGIGRLVSSTAKEILRKGIILILATWAINIAMIYFTVFLFPQSHGIPYATYSPLPPSHLNLAELLIPDNIFYALSNNIVSSVVVFGMLVGIALMHIKDKNMVMNLFETLVEAFTRITSWIAKITPIGTFLIISHQTGMMQFSTVKQVSSYLILYILTLCLIIFWIFPRLIQLLTNIPLSRWMKELFPILLLAYTTNVVIVTLPFIIEFVRKELNKLSLKDTRIQDQLQGMVSIIFNLPLGSLFIVIFVFFISCFYHIPLSTYGQIQLFFSTFLTSLGSVGMGSWINSLNFLLDSLGLPLDSVNLYLATIPFTAGFQSMLSVMQITALSLTISLACHGLIKWKLEKIVKGLGVIALPIFVLGILLKLINPFPNISNPHIPIEEVPLHPSVPCTVYSQVIKTIAPRSGEVLDRVLQSKKLRVGYNTNVIPFFFKNQFGHLSGYDAAFAYQLAADLGCSIEFVPLSFGKVAEELQTGFYDIGMCELSVTEDRLKQLYFSDPYMTSRIVFVMRKKFRKQLSSVDEILLRPHIKVCVLTGSSYEGLARKLFPSSQIVSIQNYEDFVAKYPNDVLILGEPQAISWSLNYPNFTVVTPDPPLASESFAYALPLNSDRFLAFINLWLKLKNSEGFTKNQYDLWVLGKTENSVEQEPRWSILRNWLHWVE